MVHHPQCGYVPQNFEILHAILHILVLFGAICLFWWRQKDTIAPVFFRLLAPQDEHLSVWGRVTVGLVQPIKVGFWELILDPVAAQCSG